LLPFWSDLDRVKSLSDPPSDKFLSRIQEEPWRGGLEPIPVEGIPLHEAKIIEGQIPSDLQGMLCRNGPGRIRIGDTQYGHWFDSDGVVSRLCIDGQTQKATFMAKYVETERFVAQQKIPQTTGSVPMATAGAWTKRGRGNCWENIFAIPTNPSNTNVLFLNGKDNKMPKRLFAVAEGGDPVELDPNTLNTIDVAKPFSNSEKDETVSSFFSAHYKKDPVTGDVYNHGVVLDPVAGTLVNVVKLSETGELLKQHKTELPGESSVTFIHDSFLSESYLTLIVQPYKCPSISLLSSVLGGDPLGQKLEWAPDETLPQAVALIFSKDSMECVAKIPLPLLSTYHTIDAFEDSEDSNFLTFRTLVHEPPESRGQLESGFKNLYTHSRLPICLIMEYRANVVSQKIIYSRQVAPSTELCELPDVNTAIGYRKRYVWTNTRTEDSGWLDSLQKVDLEKGENHSNVVSFGATSFAGNPIFIPKANAEKEDDGYILSQIYRSDEHRSDICILDASSMRQLALLSLDSHITYQFHGSWCPGKF